MAPYRSILLFALVTLVASGCNLLPNKGADYRTQGTKVPSLEVPPDLTAPVADDRFLIPDQKSSTYSTYSRDRAGATTPSSGGGVLPKIDNVRIERSGDQRWLVIKATPEKIWPVVKEFWQESGFIINRETPAAGIMETDWAENRSKIPQDFVRNTVGKLLDGLYSSGERDKFRTRLEVGTEPGTTEVFISHRGLEEVFTSPKEDSTKWQPRATDHGLEAEMLGRLMTKFGVSERAKSAALDTPSIADRAAYDSVKGGPLRVADAFDRAWRRVGLALDNSGFTVEDRDRSKGIFFVRYQDPEAEVNKSKGFLDKLAFWRKENPAAKASYRVHVAEVGGGSDVVVQTADGKVDSSPTAKRILALLHKQLK